MREKLKVHDGDTPGKVIEVKLEYLKPKVMTMSDIKCPICGNDLEQYHTGLVCYRHCLNDKNVWGGEETLKELIRTRKALKMASDCMKIMYDNLPDGNRWKWEIEKTLEQIKITMQEQPNDN